MKEMSDQMTTAEFSKEPILVLPGMGNLADARFSRRAFLVGGLAGAAGLLAGREAEAATPVEGFRVGGIDYSLPYVTDMTDFTGGISKYKMSPMAQTGKELDPRQVKAFDAALNISLVWGTELPNVLIEYAHTWRSEGKPLPNEWLRRRLDAQREGHQVLGYTVPTHQGATSQTYELLHISTMPTPDFWETRGVMPNGRIGMSLGMNGLKLPSEVLQKISESGGIIKTGCADKQLDENGNPIRGKFVSQMIAVLGIAK